MSKRIRKDAMVNKHPRILRHRDVIAALAAILLSKLSYSYSRGSESLSATIDLSFFTDFKSHTTVTRTNTSMIGDADIGTITTTYDYKIAKPVPFDLDGDGIVEAIVAATQLDEPNSNRDNEQNDDNENTNSNSRLSYRWGLKVLDLKPLHPASSLNEDYLPFYPDTIFATHERGRAHVPVKMVTGNIILHNKERVNASADMVAEIWKKQKEDASTYAKTPNGGLPSVVTVWSNGDVSLHSITYRKEDQSMSKSKLELVEMWNVNPFDRKQGVEDSDWIDFIEVALLLEDEAPVGQFGALVAAVRYYKNSQGAVLDDGVDVEDISTIYFALDAFSGDLLWKNDVNADVDKMEEQGEQDHVKSEDQNRELSSLTGIETRKNIASDGMHQTVSTQDCLHHFGKIIVEESSGIQSHAFWHHGVRRGSIELDTKLISSHLDAKSISENANIETSAGDQYAMQNRTKSKWLAKTISEVNDARSNKKRRQNSKQPNVAVFHNRQEMNVISLENGEQICQLPLSQNVLYADVNQDGIVDQIEVTTKNTNVRTEESPCEAIIYSGIDRRNKIASIPLCKDKNNNIYQGSKGQSDLSAAPPLLVESIDDLDGLRYDVVFAINNGLLKRYDSEGRAIWSERGFFADYPGWDDVDGNHNGYLDRIAFAGEANKELLGMRPILLMGDNKCSIFTAGRGRILDRATFPQMVVGRPTLADLNGDGTSDILVTTVDGIWGYCIKISIGRSKTFKIMNCFLFLFVFFAALIGFCDAPGKEHRRATDQ